MIGGSTALVGRAVLSAASDSWNLSALIPILAFTLCFPAIYLLGFHRYLPESIGGVAAAARGDAPERLRRFLRIAWGLVAAGQAALWLYVIIENDSPLPEILAFVGIVLATAIAAGASCRRPVTGRLALLGKPAAATDTDRRDVRYLRLRHKVLPRSRDRPPES